MEILEREGRRAAVKVAREELVLLEFEMEPKTDGAGLHFHRRHVDAFYVLKGELELTVSGETVHPQQGELVHAAPGVVHSFKNASGNRVRFLNLHTPGMRFDEYMRRMDAGEDPDPEDYDVWEVE
ncbi:MAG TPA: cupin domain-containing protein [Gaiellaceae bacterium]